MCYAIPGKVKEIRDKIVVVDYFGEEKKAINELDDLQVGDHIYAQGGYVIERIPLEQALSILSVWKETFFELQEADLRLSQLDMEKEGVDKRLTIILDKILENIKPKKEELLYLLDVVGKPSLELIYKTANFLRHKHLKNSCCVHGIIEISNYCPQKCVYCGISAYNKMLPRYRMEPEEIIKVAVEAVKKFGFRALVLQSGEDTFYKVKDLANIIKRIKQEVGVLICISFGEVGLEGLEQLYQAGARAILMRFETSNPKLYEQLHPGRKLDTRIAHIKRAREIGYLVMTGSLIGIKGQTNSDIINDIYLTKELDAEMFSFGPFLPHPQTPLAKCSHTDEDSMLKVLAVARFLDPDNAKILITTAFETLSSQARKRGLIAGANSVMLNVTPLQYRGQYTIYPNRAHDQDQIDVQISETVNFLRSLGRAPTDLGVSI